MKELSIEEKARRYDEAIKKVNDYYEGKTKLYSDVDKTLDYLFPALKESEGEKVRKMLIEFFSRGAECNSSTNGIPDKDIITWLEKHKYTEEDLDKAYKCADEVQYRRGYEDAKKEIEKQGEQKPVDEVKPKFNIGDTMRTLQEASNGITNGLPVVVFIDDEYYHCTNELIAIKDQDDYEYPALNRRQNPAWSEEDEELFTISLDNLIELNDRYGEEYGRVGECIRWFKSIKDRVQPQPKQEWSEEDKVKINRIVAFLENLNLKNLNIIDDNNTFKKDVEWLKSLKDRYTWRPSEEQMKALADAITNGHLSNANERILKGLQEQLKKL